MDPLVAHVQIGVRRALSGSATQRCPQCYRERPLREFIGLRDRLVNFCTGCQARYSGWAARTDAERLAARRPVKRTGDGYTVRFVARSQNRKLGPIPMSSTDMVSCPDACSLKDRGCYAGYGKIASHWSRVATEGLTWSAFCAAVAALPPGTLWRHNDAGDLPGRGDELDTSALAALVRANRGRRGFTFTHKPLRRAAERRAVMHANEEGFVIALSADGPAHADELADLRIGPVVTILPADAMNASVALHTPAGRRIVVCPASTHAMTCADCQLCSKPREAIVGFPAHGQGARLVTLRLGRTS